MTAHVASYHSHYHSKRSTSGRGGLRRFHPMRMITLLHCLRYVRTQSASSNMVSASQDREGPSLLPNGFAVAPTVCCAKGPCAEHSAVDPRFVKRAERKRNSKHCVTVFRGDTLAIRHGSSQRPSTRTGVLASTTRTPKRPKKLELSPFAFMSFLKMTRTNTSNWPSPRLALTGLPIFVCCRQMGSAKTNCMAFRLSMQSIPELESVSSAIETKKGGQDSFFR